MGNIRLIGRIAFIENKIYLHSELRRHHMLKIYTAGIACNTCSYSSLFGLQELYTFHILYSLRCCTLLY